MIAKHAALTLIVGTALGLLIWEHPPAAWSTMQDVGICLLVLGFILWTTARFHLGKSFALTAKANELVTGGIYSRIRNPIYVFGSCVIAGVELRTHRVWTVTQWTVFQSQSGDCSHVESYASAGRRPWSW